MRMFTVATGLVLLVGTAQADLIAYWDFNNSVRNTAAGSLGVLSSTDPTQGAGSITLSSGLAFNMVSNSSAVDGDVGVFTGSSLNLLSPSISGRALAVQGALGSSGPTADNNGQYIQFNLDMSTHHSLMMSFAAQGSSDGFGTSITPNRVLVSNDFNGGFRQVGTFTATQSAYRIYNFQLGSAFNANCMVRIMLDGATSAGGFSSIDNVQFRADTPAPGTFALLGLGGVMAGRRRR